MNLSKIKAVFFILVFLLALALVVNWAMKLDAKKHANDVPPAETEISEPQQPAAQETPAPITGASQNVPTAPTPVPQQSNPQPQNNNNNNNNTQPAPTPAPTPAPAPTPVPTPTPVPAGLSLGSGSFSSDTGTGLNLLCDWSAVTAEGNKATVTLTIGVRSSSIYLNEWTDNIGLRVGDQTATMTQPSLDYTGGETTHTFGSKTFTVDLSKGRSFPVAVEWHYNGSYGGTPIDVIPCGGTINLG